TFTADFKLQMVKLYENGKSRADIAREYDITPSALDRWIKNHQETGSFKAEDNRSQEENELVELRKEVHRLRMENDIFKASSADHGTKIDVIRHNAHKYSVSADVFCAKAKRQQQCATSYKSQEVHTTTT
ncbi:transposase, partial [Lysinibacillus pakistanensis]|uniref:transposase n=2 Tax=Lysinibacillus TaxID=400634 RepID=UPI0035E42BC6